jgi:hypothetical protein
VGILEHSIVVAASRGYEPGLKSFLGSFEKYHDPEKIRVHVLTLEMPNLQLPGWCNRVALDWVSHPQGGRNTAWSTKIPRFKYAAELDGVVMLADSDMFFCANIDNWFKIAETGLIVCGSNGSNVRYHEVWRQKYKLNVPDFFNYKTICSVPTVMRTDLHKNVWLDLYNHKMPGGEGADFDLQNIFMTIHKKHDRMFPLPSQQTTGIHHFMLKPDTRALRVDGKLISRDGLEIFIVHGKWWQENWRNNLMVKMTKYCNENKSCVRGAQDSINILYEEFLKYQ